MDRLLQRRAPGARETEKRAAGDWLRTPAREAPLSREARCSSVEERLRARFRAGRRRIQEADQRRIQMDASWIGQGRAGVAGRGAESGRMRSLTRG